MSEAQGALEGLAQLQRQISNADIRSLIALRGEVGAIISASATVTQQVGSAASALANARTLQEARDNTRAATDDFMRDYFESRKFDQWLQFASREDEQRYRRNEAARFREIEKARAEGTPEGDLRAAQLALEQLEDAGAHGADRSSEYQMRHNRLKAATSQLAAKLDTPAAEPSKGAADPLDAAKPAEVSPELLASIRASGVTLSADGTVGHGVNDLLPVMPPFMGRVCSGYAPQWGGLQSPLV